MTPDNNIHVKLRLFDQHHDILADFGRYENIMLQDLNIKQFMTDIRKATGKALKQLEIDITNFKKGTNE